MYKSVFHSDDVLQNIRKNIADWPQCAKIKEDAVHAAEYWMNLSYDELYGLVFDPKLERSWMVLSSGSCPDCKNTVLMYDWIIDAIKNPWKVRCPHCGSDFPKNDFEAYYQSGLTKTGKFSYGQADPSLLYNAESKDPNDRFGVDQGFGYREGDTVWRFIATYLVYGQWIQLVLGGIDKLSKAYVYTDEPEYARRAIILLDRLADFFPEYDYNNQGWMYERFNLSVGYLSYGVNGAFEACTLATAYDAVAKQIHKDDFVVAYLVKKPSISQGENIKKNASDIQNNIETRIIEDFLEHPIKLSSNYPYTERALAVGKAVLHWWKDKECVLEDIYEIVRVSTLYDGMTGESSPAGYATMGKHGLAQMLNLFLQADPDLIDKVYRRVPSIYQAYRFHIDIHCLDKYYPTLGDDGYFCMPRPEYPNGNNEENLVIWKLYEITQDADLLKVLVRDQKDASCLFDSFLFEKKIKDLSNKVQKIVEKTGVKIECKSIKKDTWEIAILRSGKGAGERAVWFNFGGNKTHHSHGDALSYGMYWQKADLMTDLGYPNVAFGGGWWSDEAAWTMGTISHNVVTRNRKAQIRKKGTMKTWLTGDFFQVATADVPGLIEGSSKMQRTLALADVDDADFYIIDICKVQGGAGLYERFTRANTGVLSADGYALEPFDAYEALDEKVFMKDFKKAVRKKNDAVLSIHLEDVLDTFDSEGPITWQYIDLCEDCELITGQSWVPPSPDMLTKGHKGFWMPVIINAKRVDEKEEVTFVSLIHPHIGSAKVEKAVRLSSEDKTDMAISVSLSDGTTDVILLKDELSDQQAEWTVNGHLIQTDMRAAMVRLSKTGELLKSKATKGKLFSVDGNSLI